MHNFSIFQPFNTLIIQKKLSNQTRILRECFLKQLLNFVLKHVVVRNETAFVEKSSFRHENESAYD